jgi:phenylalanyl-tRNA synthetase beta chain
MRVPMSWLREFVAVPATESARSIGEKLVRAGFEVEAVEEIGHDLTGPLIIGRVEVIKELTEFKKPIRFCQVDVGVDHGGVRGIVCGANNFVAGDLVVVALPGAVLSGGFAITARETYGHTSDGMICSERELGLSDEHTGIMVLPAATADPGADALAILGLPDAVLDISVNTDRGYAMSMRGMAREVATAYGLDFVDPAGVLAELPDPAVGTPHEGVVEDPASCDLLVLRTVEGFDAAAGTPVWMRRRLSMCGMRSVSLAVDVTNYVMLEMGQPLHAFDGSRLRGPIVVRRAHAGETLETLDHEVRNLDADDLLITDDRGPISIAGVMGGLETEIDNTSTSIVLEAAHFDAQTIARAGRRHRLGSEASRRFERGVDRMIAPFASARAVQLLLEHGGGTYIGAIGVEFAPHDVVIDIAEDLAQVVAGTPISVAESMAALESVGCNVVARDGRLVVTPPTWRPDLVDPYDLVEEVVRLHGYENLPTSVPRAPAQRGLTMSQRLRRRIGFALAGDGFTEALQYPFISEGQLDALLIPAGDQRRRAARLANPLSEEQPFMRTTLLPGLLETLKRNVARGESDVALFELGAVHVLRDGQSPVLGVDPARPAVDRRPTTEQLQALEEILPREHRHVAAVLCGEREREGWWGSGSSATWADAIEAARVVADAIGVTLDARSSAAAPWHPGRCAELVLVTAHGEWPVGHAGELHPRVTEALGLPVRACAMELRLDDLFEAAIPTVTAMPLATMPVAKEDIALVVPVDVPAAEVEAAIRAGAGDLLESARLFDVYTGEQVAPGHKSLAYALRFRATDRTLTDLEIAAARQGAIDSASAATGAVLRG